MDDVRRLEAEVAALREENARLKASQLKLLPPRLPFIPDSAIEEDAEAQATQGVVEAARQFVTDTRWSMQSIRLRDAVAALDAARGLH